MSVIVATAHGNRQGLSTAIGARGRWTLRFPNLGGDDRSMSKRSAIETDQTPFRTAHVAVEPDGLTRLTDSRAVLNRYRLPGPHVTVVMPIATPGRPGNNMEKRWSATRADLRHLGADEDVLRQLERTVSALPPCGYQALVTANASSAAYCWLITPTSGSMMRVADLPSLVPALIEVDRRPRVVTAAVDRVGADLAVVDHAHIESGGAVDGETEGIHKSSGDGADQARNQRHSEVIWERNASDVATQITKLVDAHSAPLVVLSGDRRAVDLVAERVTGPNVTVRAAQAGGRREPDTGLRLLAAAISAAEDTQAAAWRADHDRLREELGQQDLAVDGEVHTLQAIADHRVSTLVIDSDTWARRSHIDETIRAADVDGAGVCLGSAPELNDGIGALLRRAY